MAPLRAALTEVIHCVPGEGKPMRRVTIAVFGVLWILCSGAFAQETLMVGDLRVGPGEMQSGFLKVPAGADAPEIQLPVTVINGIRPGPVLALTAGIHGYEYPPIIALQRLRGQIEPKRLSGGIILVHIVNLPSFLKRTIYYNPYDWKNMNRVFPGKADGSICERIAFRLSKEVVDRCDFLLDLHCGDGNEDLTPYIYCTETGNPDLDRRTRDLSVNFGFKVIIHETVKPNEPSATLCANSALLKGKPALTVESGRLGRTDEEDIARLSRGVLNTLKHLKMTEGLPELPPDNVWVRTVTYVRSDFEGIFYPLGQAGRHVEKGEVLGYLTDYFGNILQKAVAPHGGMILYIAATPPVSKGEPMVKIGAFQ
jgi:predicted deacylase